MQAVPQARAHRPLLPARPHEQERADEDQVGDRVDGECSRDAERADDRGGRYGSHRAGDVERHRVEGDCGRHLLPLHQRDEESLLGGGREGRDDSLGQPERDDECRGGEIERRDQRQDSGQQRGQRLGDEQEPPPVESVRGASGPRSEKEDRRELGEGQHSEQELGAGQPEDEDRGREVLEPRSARGEGVSDEVRAELPRADERERRPGPDLDLLRTLGRRGLGYARPALCRAA